MISASQHSRRIVEAESSSPVSVCASPVQVRSWVWSIVTVSRGDGAVGLGQHVSGLQQSAGLDEGVEHPGAVVAGVAGVAGVAAVVPASGFATGGGVADRAPLFWLWGGEGDEGGFEEGGVLGGAAALDPGSAGLVVGDGQVATQVGGSFETVQGFLVAAFVAVGVDDGGQVECELAELGGVEVLGLGQEDLDSAGAEVGVAGEPVDGSFDDVGLGGREPAIGHGLGDRGQDWFCHCLGEAHECGAGAFVAARNVGEVVLGGGPPGLLDRTGRFELADDAELDASRVVLRASISAMASVSSAGGWAAQRVSVRSVARVRRSASSARMLPWGCDIP